MEDELVDFEEVYDDKNQENKMYVHILYFISFSPYSINFNSERILLTIAQGCLSQNTLLIQSLQMVDS